MVPRGRETLAKVGSEGCPLLCCFQALITGWTYTLIFNCYHLAFLLNFFPFFFLLRLLSNQQGSRRTGMGIGSLAIMVMTPGPSTLGCPQILYGKYWPFNMENVPVLL